MEKVLIVGSSGHAKVVIDIVEKRGELQIAGLIDSFRAPGENTLNHKVLGTIENVPALAREFDARFCFVAIGDNTARARVTAEVRKLWPAVKFARAVHPNAQIGMDVEIGEGTVVMSGVAVNPSTRIGEGCILNTHSSVDHDCRMGDFSSLAPGVTVGGGTKIGVHSAIGIGAVLKHAITVGDHTVIGAGATVLENIGDLTVALGTPAKSVRSRKPGDKYL